MKRILLSFVLALALIAPVQTSRFFNGPTNGDGIAFVDSRLDMNGALSICAWIMPNSATNAGRIFQHGDSATAPNTEYNLHTNTTGKLILELGTTAAFSLTSVTSITTAAWMPICALWDGTTSSLFMGSTTVEVSQSQTGTLANLTDASSIGYSSQFSNNVFGGRIAEVTIWTGTIGAVGVGQYIRGAPPRTLSGQLPVGYFPMVGQSPEPNFFSPVSGTVSGTTIFPHPPVMR